MEAALLGFDLKDVKQTVLILFLNIACSDVYII